jgi:hypothetical protein
MPKEALVLPYLVIKFPVVRLSFARVLFNQNSFRLVADVYDA